MIMVFQRHVVKGDSRTPDRVQVQVIVSNAGKVKVVGLLEFDDKQTWARFFGAVQKGALDIKDMTIKMEDSPKSFTAEENKSAVTK